MVDRESASQEWHSLPIIGALRALDSSLSGLSEDEAARRLTQHGPNRVNPAPPASALHILTTQFQSIVMLLLIAAAVLSWLLGDRVEAASIGVVIAINAGTGFVIELRARRAMEALRQLGAAHASVLRNGRLAIVDAQTLVPGDVVEVNAGQTVPADGRIISETDLRTNEAALTGESLPVSKHVEVLPAAETPLADRVNMVYHGTTVAAGTARVLVTETGNRTQVGQIGALTQSLGEEKTPLERRLDLLGRRLVWLALGVAAVVALLGLAQGQPWALMVEMSIALAVAAVPEGLPAVATIALAVGLHRMARRHALVRRLPAVEALGSTTVICTDKTRTLTSGEMSVVRVWTDAGDVRLSADGDNSDTVIEGLPRHALEVAILASRLHAHEGSIGATTDSVDSAIVKAAERSGLDAASLVATPPAALIPFSSERKFMASFHHGEDGLVAYVKGAPGRILEMSDRLRMRDGGAEPLDKPRRAEMRAVNQRLAADGLRVLAIASGPVTEPTETGLRALTLEGFAGLMDPPAPGVKEAIGRLRKAGLRTVMLTGDQRLTAEAIGRELGLLSAGDQAIESRELRALTEQALRERVPHIGTFSRIAPEDKLTIVRALQARDEIVAMLGDGVNDAPALRKADVGVAMGIRGTDVAKDAAAIVLQDDRFETIVAAVEEGRVIFDNIRKFVFYLFSCNIAEVLVLLITGAAGLPLPLMPLQILWLNMVTDTFPALALAMEPGDPDVMDRPPRNPQEAILSHRFLLSVLFYGGSITASTLAAFLWALTRPATDATTVAFMTLALAQIFHLGNARSSRAALHPSVAFSNPYAIGAVALSVSLQLAALYVEPLARVLRVAPLGADEWLVVLVCASVTAVAGQTLKLWR